MRVTISEDRLPDVYAAVRMKLVEIFGKDESQTIDRNDECAPRAFCKKHEIDRIFRLESIDMSKLVKNIKKKQKKNDSNTFTLDELTMSIIRAKVFVPKQKSNQVP